MVRTTVMWLCWGIVLAALYLILVDTTVQPEVIAGILTAAFSALVVVGAIILERVQFKPKLRWYLMLLRRLPAKVLTDSSLVFLALWRSIVRREEVAGEFYIVPFNGGGDDAHSAARRALVIAGLSLPPNSYVVALDANAGHLIVHQLVEGKKPPGDGDREWPL